MNMIQKRQYIPVGGLLGVLTVAGYMVVQLAAQPAARDLSTAASAEVRDPQGQVLLSGRFAQVDEDDDDIERKAQLAPAGSGSRARGEAEIEFAPGTSAAQEVEFSIDGAAAGTVYTFAVDGLIIGNATADREGHAEAEIEVPQPAAASAQ